MTAARLTKRRTVLEKNAAEVVAVLACGDKHADVARMFGCSREGVSYFANKYEAEIAALQAERDRQITDARIADQVQRVLDADADYQALGAVMEARATDMRYTEPGYRTGTMAHSLKSVGSGENAQIVSEFKVDTALIAERRALRRAVAEELNQIARPAINVQVNDNRRYVLTWDDGTPAGPPLLTEGAAEAIEGEFSG